MPRPSARDWTIYAKLMVRWATSTSLPCRPRASTTPSTWSTWTSTSTRARPFTVSRIEFQGNTITRDRVIRRELLLEEGQPYNSNLWEQSLLRLNQLDYFDPLKVDQDTEIHPDADNGTVSLLLKVHEKGKNSIGLNGGVSGLSGTFLGLNYSTNNFLGLGETLSLQGNIGNLARSVVFAFNEPYLRNKPTSVGFQVFSRKTDYNSARNYAAVTGNRKLDRPRSNPSRRITTSPRRD